MVGILSGAVTNTPGLGAAQQANSDLNGIDAPEIALGYAVAYPLGVVGIILSLIALKYICVSIPRQKRRKLNVDWDTYRNSLCVLFRLKSVMKLSTEKDKRYTSADEP